MNVCATAVDISDDTWQKKTCCNHVVDTLKGKKNLYHMIPRECGRHMNVCDTAVDISDDTWPKKKCRNHVVDTLQKKKTYNILYHVNVADT